MYRELHREHEYKLDRRKHRRTPSPRPAKSKLDWKVLLRGFIEGVAEYEMKKKLATREANTENAPEQRPSLRKMGKMKTNNSIATSISGSFQKTATSKISMPGPSRGRPRQSDIDEEPALTPGQVHWREVRARERGQEDMIPAEEDRSHHAKEPLAYGEDPFVDRTPASALMVATTTAPWSSAPPAMTTPTQSQPITMRGAQLAQEPSPSAIDQRRPEFFGGWSFPSTSPSTSAASPPSVVPPNTTHA
jgi:hypothetical protein